ncbi:hypothetical protein HDU86_006652 [Geranomyces michiganensis]|nr:hypothetical protein HDU86_006652 [Geranomyces michiganensis]
MSTTASLYEPNFLDSLKADSEDILSLAPGPVVDKGLQHLPSPPAPAPVSETAPHAATSPSPIPTPIPTRSANSPVLESTKAESLPKLGLPEPSLAQVLELEAVAAPVDERESTPSPAAQQPAHQEPEASAPQSPSHLDDGEALKPHAVTAEEQAPSTLPPTGQHSDSPSQRPQPESGQSPDSGPAPQRIADSALSLAPAQKRPLSELDSAQPPSRTPPQPQPEVEPTPEPAPIPHPILPQPHLPLELTPELGSPPTPVLQQSHLQLEPTADLAPAPAPAPELQQPHLELRLNPVPESTGTSAVVPPVHQQLQTMQQMMLLQTSPAGQNSLHLSDTPPPITTAPPAASALQSTTPQPPQPPQATQPYPQISWSEQQFLLQQQQQRQQLIQIQHQQQQQLLQQLVQQQVSQQVSIQQQQMLQQQHLIQQQQLLQQQANHKQLFIHQQQQLALQQAAQTQNLAQQQPNVQPPPPPPPSQQQQQQQQYYSSPSALSQSQAGMSVPAMMQQMSSGTYFQTPQGLVHLAANGQQYLIHPAQAQQLLLAGIRPVQYPPVPNANRRPQVKRVNNGATRQVASVTPIRQGLYEATYSNVSVYEMNSMNGVGIMRRKTDSWMNATHILKAAGLEKSRRTKILEREIHQGRHEKIQGGYGKYQGTWIPLARAKALAHEYGLAEYLRDLLDLPETGTGM